MADTYSQSCLAGIKTIHKLGMTKKDLIRVNMKIHAAYNKDINILWAVILRLSGNGPNHKSFETRQIVYVTDNSEKFFFSEEAAGVALDMIYDEFPRVGVISGCIIDSECSNVNNECECPKETTIPIKTTPTSYLRECSRTETILIGILQIQYFRECGVWVP